MTPSHDAPPRRRVDAWFTASYEVARRLAEGRGAEAIEVLRRELDRTRDTENPAGQRFLLSQIALCHARMGELDRAREVLEEIEREMPPTIETALVLAEGYLLLLENPERASHHAALALQWADERGEDDPTLTSRAHMLMARSLLAQGDVLGALGAWRSAPLPDWRVAVELLEAGADRNEVRQVLAEALPRHVAEEQRLGAAASAASDQVRRLIAWIDAGCPRP